ncbi:MAG: hypothetical protein L0I62_10430 [Gammaproteobacteria bacterium]|nr:hypothetical protein [Gammaproteobacteria bacterium]
MRKRLLVPLTAAMVGLCLAAFVSPRADASGSLHVEQVSIRGTPPAEVTLYGGKGYDFLRTISCAQNGCFLYGRAGKGFAPEEDYLVIRTSPADKTVWARAYGGANRDYLRTAIPAGAGGALLVGHSTSLFDADREGRSPHRWPRPFLVHLNADGKVLWAETVKMSGPTWRLRLYHGIQTADGGFLLAGYYTDWTNRLNREQEACLAKGSTGVNCRTRPENPPKDAILMRLDQHGKLEWFKRYRLKDGQYDLFTKAWSIIPLSGGNFLVSLYDRTDARIVLMSIDRSGTPGRAQTLDGIGASAPSSLVALPQGGYLLVGRDYQSGRVAATIVARFGPNGDLLHIRRYAQKGFTPLKVAQAGREHTYCIVGRNGGGLASRAAALAFSTRSSTSRTFSLDTASTTEFFDVASTADGSCLMAGSTRAFGTETVDILTYAWQPQAAGQPGPIAKAVTGAHMEKAQISAFEPASKVLRALVEPIPSDQVRVTRIPVPAPAASSDSRPARATPGKTSE